MKENLRIVEISTSSWEEENFVLLTDLDDDQISKVVAPLIQTERETDELIDNDSIANILSEKYPKNIVIMYSRDGFDYLNF